MNLTRSLKSFREVYREDAAFRRLGRPPGWSVYFHYLGRWYDRRAKSMPLRNVAFSFDGLPLAFEMTDRYLGAFKGVFVDREYDCAGLFSHPPRTVLDLGGNIGFGSVYFSRIFPQALFAVVEPDPRNLPLLQKNLIGNGVNATVFQSAVGHAAGSTLLRFGGDPTCSSLEGTGMHDLAESVRVAVRTVPDLMAQLGWTTIDLLKVDIEGAEEALLTLDNAWLAKIGALILEVHPNTTAERLNCHLAQFGFTLSRFGSGREPVYFAMRRLG